jgi:S1-C subfamily serine protease
VISANDIEQAVPLPSRPTYTPTPAPPSAPRRTSRLAIAAAVCAVAGIPLFGLLTGLAAIVMGSLALGAIHTKRQKGTGWALVGVLLGLTDIVGWAVLLGIVFLKPGSHVSIDFQPDLTALNDLEPRIGRAMRANVLIESQSGWGRLGGRAIGSGVILRVDPTAPVILTNRHVVDPDFSGEAPGKAGGPPNPTDLKVHLVDRSVEFGQVAWLAPGGIDLALLHIPLSGREIQAAQWQLGRPRRRVGDPVFAIGNPQGLGWTHTQGAISQYRVQNIAGRQVPVIQTQTVINPGNSGGGLYDEEGYLIGINTWTQDKSVSEGLSFAIALEVLADLRPPDLDLPPRPQEPVRP